MKDMEIKPAYSLTKTEIQHCDFSWSISAVIAKPYTHLSTTQPITTTPVDDDETTTKSYGFDEDDFEDIDDSEKKLWVLADKNNNNNKDNKNVYGYVLASKAWNNLVLLDDIALDKRVRGQGYGKKMVQRVVEWARESGLGGVKAETQSNNVSACHLYKKCGFEFGGYDEFLYYGIPKSRNEVALFWYYIDRGAE